MGDRWNNEFAIVEDDHVSAVRTCYNDDTRLAYWNMTIFRLQETWERTDLMLTQRIYTEAEVCQALENAGFADVQVFDSEHYPEGISVIQQGESIFFGTEGARMKTLPDSNIMDNEYTITEQKPLVEEFLAIRTAVQWCNPAAVTAASSVGRFTVLCLHSTWRSVSGLRTRHRRWKFHFLYSRYDRRPQSIKAKVWEKPSCITLCAILIRQGVKMRWLVDGGEGSCGFLPAIRVH